MRGIANFKIAREGEPSVMLSICCVVSSDTIILLLALNYKTVNFLITVFVIVSLRQTQP